MHKKYIFFCTEFHIYFSTCFAIIFSRRLTRAGDHLDEALFGAKKVKLNQFDDDYRCNHNCDCTMLTKIETMQLMVITLLSPSIASSQFFINSCNHNCDCCSGNQIVKLPLMMFTTVFTIMTSVVIIINYGNETVKLLSFHFHFLAFQNRGSLHLQTWQMQASVMWIVKRRN